MITEQAIRGLILLLAVLTFLSAGSAGAESLEQAWEVACRVDHGIRAARNYTESAESSLREAKAARLPNLNLEGGYTVLDESPAMLADMIPTPLAMGQDEFLAAGARVSIPLFTSGMIYHGVKAADNGLRAAKDDEVTVLQNLKMSVGEAYVSVLRARRGLEVAESHVKSLGSHARDVEALHAQGFVADNDLLAARVALSDARQRELQATNGLDIASAAYNRLLGRPLAQGVSPDELEVPSRADVLDPLTQRALDNRSELRGFQHRIEAVSRRSSMERAAALPHLAISGGYDYSENKYMLHEKMWRATVGCSWNIFDGGKARHRSNSFKRKAEALTEQRADYQTVIALQVRQAWLNLTESIKRVAVTREAVEQGEENLEVTRDRYREGLAINTEVLDAESLRTITLLNNSNAVYDAVLANLRLSRTIGEL
jgi:outer membrane protein